MKFVRPLYRALYQSSPEGKQLAKETFLNHWDFYHPIAAKMVATDLDVSLDSQHPGMNDIDGAKRTKKWMYAGLGIGILASVGLILSRRKR